MTMRGASFSVNVDVTNPGQFFACCGLLELAHRLWPGSEGWFERESFHVDTAHKGALKTILDRMTSAELTEDRSRGEARTRPVRIKTICGTGQLGGEGFDIVLDWWIDEGGHKTPLKLWAAHQSSLSILQALKKALGDCTLNAETNLFSSGLPLTTRFGLDPRAAWNALDVGFSPNEQGIGVVTYAVVEMLASVGLQRFRPMVTSSGFQFCTWSTPLRAPVARAASVGALALARSRPYMFEIALRGSFKGVSSAKEVWA